MSDVQPSNTEFRRLLDVVGDLAAEVRSLKERQGPGHDVRLYTVPTSPPAAGPPVLPAPGPAPGPAPEVLPEAARLHRAIAYDKMERILAKDAAVYLRDPLMEACHAITEMPLRPKAGTLILFKSTETTKSEDWRAHGYRWKQCSGGKTVLQTLHYITFNIVTPDHPLPRGTNLFSMRAYKDSERPHLTLLHFIGDHNIAVDFPHGNSKGM